MMVVPNGCVVTAGAVHAVVTVTLTALLSAVPQLFETRTQYDVVTEGLTIVLVAVAPGIGFVVATGAPRDHWDVRLAPRARTVTVDAPAGGAVARRRGRGQTVGGGE